MIFNQRRKSLQSLQLKDIRAFNNHRQPETQTLKTEGNRVNPLKRSKRKEVILSFQIAKGKTIFKFPLLKN